MSSGRSHPGRPATDIVVRILDWNDAASRALPLRERVFVVEQGVPAELERDANDPACRHAIAEIEGRVVGTGRLLPDGHIGRMAVARASRGCGIGGLILEALVEEARRAGFRDVVLNAQLTAAEFYRRHGFEAEGEEFVEAGIRHRTMRRTLAPGSADG